MDKLAKKIGKEAEADLAVRHGLELSEMPETPGLRLARDKRSTANQGVFPRDPTAAKKKLSQSK